MYWKFLKIYKHKHIIESKRQIYLTFAFVAVAPEFDSTPGNFSVIEGEDITISIKAAGNPSIKTFTWRSVMVSDAMAN